MKNNQLPFPTPEIIARMDYIERYLNCIDESYDCNELTAIKHEQEELWRKYDFFDQTFTENGLVGIKDVKGNIRIPALYADIPYKFAYGTPVYHFSLPVVNKDNKMGFASPNSNKECKFLYDEIYLVGHYYIVRDEDKFGLNDCYGTSVLPCIYDGIEDPCGNVFVTEQDGMYGFYNAGGEGYISPCIYDETEEKCDEIYVCYKGVWGFVNADGNFIPEDERGTQDVMIFDTCPF